MGTLMLWVALAGAAPEMIPEDAFAVVGRTAPPMRLDTLDGEAFDLETHRGTPVVLAFWASWCGPCRAELPALSELAAGRDDVRVFAVNVDREQRLAERFMEQVSFDLPVVWDNESQVMGALDVTGMPTTFVIDANGTVKWRKTGFSRAKRLQELEQVLDGMVR